MITPGLMTFLIIASVLCAIASAAIASRKGYNPIGFFLLGLLLGLIGVAIAAIVRGEPAAPRGWKAVSCPRCNARQNIQQGQDEFECWQCHTDHPIEWV